MIFLLKGRIIVGHCEFRDIHTDKRGAQGRTNVELVIGYLSPHRLEPIERRRRVSEVEGILLTDEAYSSGIQHEGSVLGRITVHVKVVDGSSKGYDNDHREGHNHRCHATLCRPRALKMSFVGFIVSG